MARRGRDVVVLAMRADFYGRCARVPGAVAPARGATTCSSAPMRPRRAAAGRRAARRSASACASSPSSSTRSWRTSRASRARCRCCRRRCSSSGSGRDGRRLRLPPTSAPAASSGAVARLAEEAYAHLDDAAGASRARVLLRLVEVERRGQRRAPPASRWPSSTPTARTSPRSSTCSPTPAADGQRRHRRARARGAPARVAAAARLDRGRPRDLRIHRELSAAARRVAAGRPRRGRALSAAPGSPRRRSGPGAPAALNASASASSSTRASTRERRERAARRRRLAIAFGALAVGIVAIAVVRGAGDRRAQRRRAASATLTTSRELALQSGEVARRRSRAGGPARPDGRRHRADGGRRNGTPRGDGRFRQVRTLDADPMTASPRRTARTARGWSPAETRAGPCSGTPRRGAGRLVAACPRRLDRGRYAPGGESIALAFDDGVVEIVDPQLRDSAVRLDLGGVAIQSLAFSGDGKRIAVRADDGNVHVVATGGSPPTASSRATPTWSRGGLQPRRHAGRRHLGRWQRDPVGARRRPPGAASRHQSWDAAFSPDGNRSSPSARTA